VRLERLRLTNFRQHADTEIHLGPGLTAIIGPNGAGKSTLLEAIAWAIYGAPAARGTRDTIRFARADPRSPVRVELELALAGEAVRVVRTLTDAEAFVGDDPVPVATTLRGVTEHLQQRLGMNRDEFFNTCFTGQKDLQFLAQMGPVERGRFLAQVLGYERLRSAQDLVRARRNELSHEIEGLQAGLPDPGAVRADLETALGRREAARSALAEARRQLEEARSRLESVGPRWAAARSAQERIGDLEHRRELAAQEYRAAVTRLVRADDELATVAGAAAELERLGRQLEPLPDVVRGCERWAELAVFHERRRVLEESAGQLSAEIGEAMARLARLARAPHFAARSREHLARLAAEVEAAAGLVERERDVWQQDRQEIRTRLATYRDRTAELQQKLDQLREAGPEGECPTCRRPLHDHFDLVMTSLEDEWESLVQDGKWLKKRDGQLAEKPPALTAAEQVRSTLAARVERTAHKLRRSEQAVEERAAVAAGLARRQERLAALEREVAEVPGGYDPVAHRSAERRLNGLREVERRVAALRETVSRRARLEEEVAESRSRRDAAAARGLEARAELETLAQERAGYGALRAEYEAAAEAARTAELAVTAAMGRADGAEEGLAAARKASTEHDARRRVLEDLESDRRHHGELDAAFTRLRAELNARVRPELGELASVFLADITGGRYTDLEIDENYNILVLDEGEEKPVISGGEEDVANLVLRLAISQMVAERAGQPLGVLILDEVFAALDLERRDAVIQLLHGLTTRFEQVILISHIDAIREGLDQVIECAFDERTGASRVRTLPSAGAAAFGAAAPTAGAGAGPLR
jgi:DNA repair protein SbcC/Rad50